MANIVISYRREDSKWITGRIFDRLEAHFGVGNVFMDIDNIPIGSDFRDHLQDILGRCDVVVAVVGPDWLKPDDSGRSRLHEKNDWVRIEIATALEKKLPVIPLLVDGTSMPTPEQLPEELQGFAFRQAAILDSGIDFRSNMQRLLTALDRLLAQQRPAAVSQPSPPQTYEPSVASNSPATPTDELERQVKASLVDARGPSEGGDILRAQLMTKWIVIAVTVSALAAAAIWFVPNTPAPSLPNTPTQSGTKLPAAERPSTAADWLDTTPPSQTGAK